MKKILSSGGTCIEYILEYKNVKNVNVRIKSDGKVYVSVSRCVPQKAIEDFLLSKSIAINNALQKIEQKSQESPVQYFDESEIKNVVLNFCKRAYPYFEKQGINFPVIKFRKMVSRWGSCHCSKGVLTFNTNLMYAPACCIEYVVLHEFTHFLQPNHSENFYNELSKVCPEWKELRKKLKEIKI